MFKKSLTPLLFISSISVFFFQSQSVKAFDFTLTDGGNSATYSDNSGGGNYGFNDWQVNNETLLTKTGLFYRVGNTGKVQTLDTLIESNTNVSSNSATVNYAGTGFDIDREFSLSNGGSTLNQIATVNNTSGSTLDFELFSYYDLVTSNGNAGDTIAINNSSYTATQSGDRDTLVTTVTENVMGSNTALTARKSEIDAIDFVDDTFNKILNENNLQLDNNLTTITDLNNPVSFAYQWDYELGSNESFSVAFNSSNNVVAVPFEPSSNLSIFILGIITGGCYLKRKFK